MSQPIRNCHYTWNNPTAEPKFDSDSMYYHIYGWEIAPDTGTPHWQGYIQLRQPMRIRAIQKLAFGGVKVHCGEQYAKGNVEKSINYIKKDGKFTEHGKRVTQGERADLNELKTQIMEGKTTVDDIVIDRPMAYHQYGRTLREIERIKNKRTIRPSAPRQCLWIYGPPGIGKSKIVRDTYPETDTGLYVKINDNGNWDDYQSQKQVLIEEASSQIPWHELMQITDRYSTKVKRRYGPRNFIADTICFTDEHPPEVYYQVRDRNWIQFTRRIKIMHIDEVLRVAGQGSVLLPDHFVTNQSQQRVENLPS